MIIDLQRRIAEIGRIRIGEQVETKGGRTRPAKLDTFRLTSNDPQKIRQAAEVYGGQPREWQSPAGKAFEVITEATSLDVMVPPSDMAFSQHYEMWSAGGCQRRCDGARESISDGPCKCDPEDRECAIHTRLSVMLRDLPGLGVWRIDTSGYYAAVELQGAVQVIQIAAGRGQILPARLRLDQRVVKRVGRDGKPETRRFAVPVLDVEISPGQLLAGPPAFDANTAAELRGPQRAALTPVPETVPERPALTVAQQVAERPKRSQRSNAAQPVPATGVEPRTVAQASGEPLINLGQMRKMQALFTERQFKGREDRHAFVTQVCGIEVASSKDLTVSQASQVIDRLEHLDNPEPATDDDHAEDLAMLAAEAEADEIADREEQ